MDYMTLIDNLVPSGGSLRVLSLYAAVVNGSSDLSIQYVKFRMELGN